MSTQAMEALALANSIRSRRAAERNRVYALSTYEGRAAVADLLDDLPDWLESERIGRLLTWPRRTGRAYVTRLLTHVASTHWAVGESTRVHMLTPPQRKRLASALREGVNGVA